MSLAGFILQLATKGRGEPGQSREVGTSSKVPVEVVRTQSIGPSSTAFPRPLAWLWIGSGTDGI